VRIAVIVNGISLRKNFLYETILPSLKNRFNLEIFQTQNIHDGVDLASGAADKHFDVILAAGGDGTVHQVVNGILQGRESNEDLPTLGVIPIGTGNDLARGLGLTTDVKQLLTVLTRFEPIKIDVGKVDFTAENGTSDSRYFINVADIGMGPDVVKRVMASTLIFGSAFAYYTSILSTFIRYKPVTASVKTEDWHWSGKLRTLAIANGNYYGHGLCIAPEASVTDGVFETFICGNASITDFVLQSRNLKLGRKIVHDEVTYLRASKYNLSAGSKCGIEADGEFLGWLPARVSLIPQRLKLLAP
jgi:diacylglycerol kinase (ATP)